jgi:hypothetical protein
MSGRSGITYEPTRAGLRSRRATRTMIQMSSDNMSRDSGSSLVDPPFGLGDESLLFISEKSVPFVQGPYRGGAHIRLALPRLPRNTSAIPSPVGILINLPADSAIRMLRTADDLGTLLVNQQLRVTNDVAELTVQRLFNDLLGNIFIDIQV